MPAPSRYILKILLYNIEPVIWRRFSIPADASFAGLHRAIQQSLGWSGEHLHEFRHGKGKRLTNVIGPDHEEVPKGDSFQDETRLTLQDFVGRRHLPVRFLYRYDFNDDWILEIVIEDKTDEGKGKLPVLLGRAGAFAVEEDGERAGPPEDAGGPDGYMAALRGDLEWLDDDYDPEKFDPKKVKFTAR